MKNARVVNGDTSAEIRPRNWSPANMEITTLTSTQFNDQLSFYKRYDAKGTRLSNFTCGPAKCHAALGNFFKVVQDGTYPKLNDVIRVLDIQTKAQLDAAEAVVNTYKFWDRVVFKVWANGTPIVWDATRNA